MPSAFPSACNFLFNIEALGPHSYNGRIKRPLQFVCHEADCRSVGVVFLHQLRQEVVNVEPESFLKLGHEG